MPESRGESFYGGRFYYRSMSDDDYEVAFRVDDKEDSPSAYISSTYTPDQHGSHSDLRIQRQANFQADGQGTLFSSRPSSHEIDMAVSTKDARHHIPTMLGIAAQRGLTTKGSIPGASADLSPQSARMVQRAVDLGLIKNPSGEGEKNVESMNAMNWDEGAEYAHWKSRLVQKTGGEIPFETVNAGRQFARNALRRPRKDRSEQLTID